MIKKQLKIFRLLAIMILALTPQSGCDEISYLAVNCSECYIDNPTHYEIRVSVDANKSQEAIPVTVYDGPFENNNVILRDTTTSNDIWFWLETEKNYTIVAEYVKDGRKYSVVSGAKLKTRRDFETCSEPCYYVVGTRVNLKLYF
jgi:hypothetical protein